MKSKLLIIIVAVACSGLLGTHAGDAPKVMEWKAVPEPQLTVRLWADENLRTPEGGYLRPDKPEKMHVEIWTNDGRKWAAKWEEVKP